MANKTLFFLSLMMAMVVLMSANGEARKLAETSSTNNTTTSAPPPSQVDHEHCSKSTIEIRQTPTSPLPDGTPQYTVEIFNACISGCNISDIHVDCGMFSSARLINPNIFKRLNYSDCLVNDGKPFPNGNIISFVYATTFQYPLSVSNLTCH
ncbi:hypothetical protein P8452_49696 [Trifolium repens]|nr:hypothetical protein P8452_49696 [Trifolium repens]